MPLTDRDRRALKIGGIIAGVLVLCLLAIGQLGGGRPRGACRRCRRPLGLGRSDERTHDGAVESATPSGGSPSPAARTSPAVTRSRYHPSS